MTDEKDQEKNKKVEQENSQSLGSAENDIVKRKKSLQDKMGEEKPKRKGPKFNIYWVYVIILAALLGSTFLGGGLKPELAKLSEQEVKQKMLLTGDIDKIEVVKQTTSDIFLHIFPENIAKSIAEGQVLQVVDRKSVV